MTPSPTPTPSTADLADEHGSRLQACSLQWRSLGAVHRFSGPASTVRCSADNAIVREAVSEPGRGRVLVVDGGGSLERALVGDVVAGLALRNGWAGLVVNGAARDVVAVGRLALGVLVLGTVPVRADGAGHGERDVLVSFGGASVAPGARVFVDEDGMLVEAPSSSPI